MDLNIILWIGGMLFSLGIFAIKVGFGLGFSKIKWKGISLTISMYLMLFVLIAVLAEQLIQFLEPVFKKGPYLHAFMALGMIVWGIYLVRQSGSATGNAEKTAALPHYHSAIPLLIPCPVCLSAMTFSTWAALSIIKISPVAIGIGLGIVFALLTLAVIGLARVRKALSPEISLGLGMIAIGLYFMASLYLPTKIEEAKGVYKSFLSENTTVALNDVIGVLTIMFIAILIGFFTYKRQEVKG